MKIVLNDYGGHAFPLQLAAQLANEHHSVAYSCCVSNVTPRGDSNQAVLAGVAVEPIDLGRTFEKYRPLRRVVDEIDYGIRSALQINRVRPDVALLAQLPVLSLLICSATCRIRGIRSVLWLQDIQAGLVGMALIGSKRILATAFGRLERRAIRSADAVVTIAQSMADHLVGIGVDPHLTVVIENWAPLDEMPARPKDNPWSRRHGLHDRFVFLYSGTIGIKHRPELLVQLSQRFADVDDVRVVAVSQGRGADWLAEQKAELGLDNLVLMPYQQFSDLPDVLASADVLVAVLEQEAGTFSIPSKILSYLCAGRPILASLPLDNSAAELIAERSMSGLVSSLKDDFVRDAGRLHASAELRAKLGTNGRRYAEKAFDIDQISQLFFEVLDLRSSKSHAGAGLKR